MNDIFGAVYGVFQDFYGTTLCDFLYAYGSVYTQIGVATIAVSLVVSVLYYYVINHPALNSWAGWGASAALCAFICFGVALARVLAIYNAGEMVTMNVTTGMHEAIGVGMTELVNFAFSAAVVSLVVYFIVSMLMRLGSVNCSHYPHVKR